MLQSIKTNKQYENALAQAYALMQKDIEPGSKESEELEKLSVMIAEYERQHFPIKD